MRSERSVRPGLVTIDHTLGVPLDHADPAGEQIEVFAREVVRPSKEAADLPRLLWLQGGPGNRAVRPSGPPGWMTRALQDFRVVLLDQRGTGRSTPGTRQTLPDRGDAAAQSDYLRHFRADAIVRDAEAVRRALQGETPWTVLGQSYGGFCTLTYLSLAPEGLAGALFTGGLPAYTGGPDPVYRATYAVLEHQNRLFFDRFPGDREVAATVARHLAQEAETLPTGERLTPERFQTAGIGLGGSTSLVDLHYLLEDPFVRQRGTLRLSDEFLHALGSIVSFARHPLYALMHESIYCQGEASRWSAHRVRAEVGEAYDALGPQFRFTGEMIYPWLFEQDPALDGLAGTAEHLSARTDWPALYDVDRLSANDVPAAAAIYVDDLYVPLAQSRATADAVRGLRSWITNEHYHDGIRADGAAVLDRLLAMLRGDR